MLMLMLMMLYGGVRGRRARVGGGVTERDGRRGRERARLLRARLVVAFALRRLRLRRDRSLLRVVLVLVQPGGFQSGRIHVRSYPFLNGS